MESYNSEGEYIESCKRRALLPRGFLASTTSLTFFPVEKKVPDAMKMNLSLILLKEKSPLFAAVFTRNAFPGAPVRIGKELLSRDRVRGILVNNRIANVCAEGGVEDARLILAELGRLLECEKYDFFPSSTGIIGWKLPVKDMISSLPSLIEGLQDESIFPVARAIMTTDSYPKVRSFLHGEGRTVGIAKGAGMIEPNMATMLSFILTDVKLDREGMREMLHRVVEESFNRISIDGDQSTSDMVIFLSSGKVECDSVVEYEDELKELCRKLSEDVVRNGEGVGHVIQVTVINAPSEAIARGVGKAVVNSPLVKTAIFGNDPNVGRIVSSIGDFVGNSLAGNTELAVSPGFIRIASGLLFMERIAIRVGKKMVFENGVFKIDEETEKFLSDYFKDCALDSEGKRFPAHDRKVEIEIDLGSGREESTVIGSDLSYQYVRENADYRS